jgi:deoxyadenosine/deoxycytidine kinase
MQHSYLVIEGNIGAGKTTLVDLLTKKYNGREVLEGFAENPFLPKFYEDPKRYAFSVEMFFLSERYHQLNNELLQQSLFDQNTFSDYFLSKSLIFARANLDSDEFELFYRMYQVMMTQLPEPDLLVYLHRDVDDLQKNIQLRGRAYESDITNDYLLRIQESYFQFLKQQPLKMLLLDISGVNFINNPEKFNTICNIIDQPFKKGIKQIKL